MAIGVEPQRERGLAVRSGGVEPAVYTADDQLVLSPMLELWIYSRTDRWAYLLVGQGLEQVTRVPERVCGQ